MNARTTHLPELHISGASEILALFLPRLRGNATFQAHFRLHYCLVGDVSHARGNKVANHSGLILSRDPYSFFMDSPDVLLLGFEVG